MRKSLIALLIVILAGFSGKAYSQDISMRVRYVSHSTVDPDGAGTANGSVVFEFQLMSSGPTILADGFALLALYQTSHLMATPTNSVVRMGPLATASGWSQNVDNREGNPVGPPIVIGGRSFDQRMVIAFTQGTGTPNLPITNTWTTVAQVTFWTEGAASPVGGYITVEPGLDVPANSLSSDGGATEYPYLTPFRDLPVALPPSALPVTFTSFDVTCGDKGALVTWTTATEANSSHYEIEKNTNGTWVKIDQVAAAGNSNSIRKYQYLDLTAGDAQYRLKQVDLDGRFVHTNIKRTNCITRQIDIVIYPVPTRNVLNVAIRSDRSRRTELQVMDISGRIVKRQSVVLNQGNTNLTVDVSALAVGEYILMSSDPAIPVNRKFTIAR